MYDNTEAQEIRNERALAVYNRVQNKLTGSYCLWFEVVVSDILVGRDFNPDVVLSVEQQVEKLIAQATSLENLCQCFSGW